MWEVVDVLVWDFLLAAGWGEWVAGLAWEEGAAVGEGERIAFHHVEELGEDAAY